MSASYPFLLYNRTRSSTQPARRFEAGTPALRRMVANRERSRHVFPSRSRPLLYEFKQPLQVMLELPAAPQFPTTPYLGSYSDRARHAPVNGMYRGRQIWKDYENCTLSNDLMPATCQPWRRPKEELWASTQKLPVGHIHGACVRIGRSRLSSLWRADENTCCHQLSGYHPEDFNQPWPPQESPAHRPCGIGPRDGVRVRVTGVAPRRPALRGA